MVTLREEPSRTLTLRNQAVRDVNKHFDLIKSRIRQYLKANPTIVSLEGGILFGTLEERLEVFKGWLAGVVSTDIFDNQELTTFINAYVQLSYRKSVLLVRTETNLQLRRAGLDVRLPQGTDFISGVAARARATIIYGRSYRQLRGITDAMETQIARVLSDGILAGRGITDIGRALIGRVNKIGRTRAHLMARTEIVYAHNFASINEGEHLQGLVDEPVKYRWRTSLDGRERPSHRARNGRIYTLKEVRRLIGEPNCRCAVSPWLKGFEGRA